MLLFSSVSRWVHTNAFVADAVYWGAHYGRSVWINLRHAWAAVRKVSPAEAFAVREVSPASFILTGVTNICNAKCTFCAYPKAVKNKALQTGVMSMETFKKVIDEWAARGGTDVDLTPTVGDTLVDVGVIEKIRYAAGAGVRNVYLTTNGILLNRNELYRQLVDAGVKGVFISTQGTSKEVYEKVYGVDHYEEVISGVHNLLEYNRQRGEPATVVIRFRNAERPSQIIRSKDFQTRIKPYLSRKVAVNFTVDFDNWGGSIKREDIADGVMKLRAQGLKINVPCRALFGFAVRHDGSVRVCGCRFKTSDRDDMIVGNIHDQSLLEISSGPRAWSVIEGFYNGKRPESCHDCTFYVPIDRKWLKQRRAFATGQVSSIAQQ